MGSTYLISRQLNDKIVLTVPSPEPMSPERQDLHGAVPRHQSEGQGSEQARAAPTQEPAIISETSLKGQWCAIEACEVVHMVNTLHCILQRGAAQRTKTLQTLGDPPPDGNDIAKNAKNYGIETAVAERLGTSSPPTPVNFSTMRKTARAASEPGGHSIKVNVEAHDENAGDLRVRFDFS